MENKKKQDTSWNRVSNWYDQIVAKEGHYYHQEVIFPFLQTHVFSKLKKEDKILELACGQGVLERKLNKENYYVGIDLAKDLIKSATQTKISDRHQFLVKDITLPFQLDEKFDVGFIILALQNVKDPMGAMRNFMMHIKPKGKVYIVLNHPTFRIPRQSSWGVDEAKKIQYRRIDRYMSPMEIPIAMEPSKGKASEQTFSYHHPLSFFSQIFYENQFAISKIDELLSNKTSVGSVKKMEDRARNEFPLFMVLELIKL